MASEIAADASTRPREGNVRRAATAIMDVLADERDRLALWVPVAFGCGIAGYFVLRSEPSFWIAPVVALGAASVAIAGRHRFEAAILAIVLTALSLGFAVAQWRAHDVAAPTIERRLGPVDISGRVIAVDIRTDSRRIVLDRLTVAGLRSDQTPARIRITIRQPIENWRPGDRVGFRAILLPPPAPAAPGAYDFQRQAWFDRLGGVGFATGNLQNSGPADVDDLWALRLASARQAVVERTLAVIPGPAGAIAAALLTGEQGAVPADVMEWMRDSGLAHLLSISGLHIGLVAGIVFFALRLVLALIPYITLRYPIKKWAAVGAFIAISFYTLFASPGVPTQRAWLMTSIVLFAILVDRTALSMRLIAWAALAVMIVRPESLLGPSFQMSFAAVVALIAAWEVTRAPLLRWRSGAGVVRHGLLSFGTGCLTTLVAGLATAPYALYHFNRFTAFGLAANFLAVPLTSLWVMPWAVLAFIFFPVGLEQVALIPMGWGVDGIIAIAREVASWDGSVALFSAMPPWGLAVITMSGLWLCLWRTRWRLAGIPLAFLGLASIATERGPDLLVSGDARLLAVRGADGLLQVSAPRASALTRDTWLRRAGQEEAVSWPNAGISADGVLACDRLGCLYTVNDQVAALVRSPAALIEDCRVATVVVSTVPVRRNCTSAQLVIDRFALWRNGGHAIWLENGSARAENVRESRGDRPWVPKPPLSRREREARSGG